MTEMKRKFNIILIFNYISLVIMAISGLMMNSLIAIFYGAESLGIFSETYAWYLILSQLSVWGIHMAVVKFVPESDSNDKKGDILKTGIFLTIVISMLIAGVSEVLLVLFKDLPWQRSMRIAFSGLVLISINKVLINYLNAVNRMIAYAAFTSLRYASIGLIILIESLWGVTPDFLAFVFPVTEIIVLISMCIYFITRLNLKGQIKRAIVGEILCFGTKILPSYMVLELNAKVDVVCLGMLVKNVSQIGIYSFAIFFTEGFYMLYIMIRKIINPGIAKANAEERLIESIQRTTQDIRRYVSYGGIIVYIGISIGYLVICLLFGRLEYRNGIVYILIIGLSIWLNGKSIVFGDLLAQIGFPLEESILNIVTVGINFILNIFLIFAFGTVGAACATAISYFVFTYYMRWRVQKRSGIIL